MNELALKIYNKGYDARFQVAQAIPVFVNELFVRLMYAVRRALRYLSANDGARQSSREMWAACEPFSNATVKRMLMVAHGSFCLVDIGDVTMRGLASGGAAAGVAEFAMRLNIIGVGRFAISLYGEVTRGGRRRRAEEDIYFLSRKRLIVEDYARGLRILAELYDDQQLLTLVDDFRRSDAYKEAFEKSVQLAEKRGVPEDKILRSKSDIDEYFMSGGNRG